MKYSSTWVKRSWSVYILLSNEFSLINTLSPFLFLMCFYFGIVLYLQTSCQDSTKFLYMPCSTSLIFLWQLSSWWFLQWHTLLNVEETLAFILYAWDWPSSWDSPSGPNCWTEFPNVSKEKCSDPRSIERTDRTTQDHSNSSLGLCVSFLCLFKFFPLSLEFISSIFSQVHLGKRPKAVGISCKLGQQI